MKKRHHAALAKMIAVTFLAFALHSCSTINTLLQEGVKKPDASVTNARISGLSFSAVDLLFDVEISNPNSMGINLQGFDYDFEINNLSFLKGDNQDGLEIGANGSSTVQIPLTVGFNELYQTFNAIKNLDSTSYSLKTGFSFNLPVLGAVRIPVSKSGNIPLLKMPSISLGSLKLNSMGLTGADLELVLDLENTNGLPLNLDKLDYQFEVNGRQWGLGEVTQNLSLNQNSTTSLKIPLSLNFLQMGRSIYDLINGDNALNYNLSGNADITSSMELLKALDLDFAKSGQVNLRK